MRSLFISLLFVLFSLFSSAQDNSYRNNNYKWDDDQPKRLSVMSEYINEPAVILDEKTNIEILEDKFFEHFRFNYYIEKTLRIRYQSNKGITQYSKFSLPESFDPAASNYGLTLEEQKHMHRPKGDFNVIVNFAARIIKPDGSIVKAEISDSSEVEKFYIYPSDKNFVNENNSFSARLNGEYQSFPEQKHFAVHFTIKNLQVDDELEVHYIVKHVFMPSRIFFNGTLPKQSFDLNLKSSNRGHIYFVNQFNGAVFKDSLREGNFFKYHWHLSNIAGCLAEKGARNYMELPYISIHLNKLDFGTLDDKGNFKNALPYTWASALLYFVAADAPLSKDLLNNPMAKVNINFENGLMKKQQEYQIQMLFRKPDNYTLILQIISITRMMTIIL